MKKVFVFLLVGIIIFFGVLYFLPKEGNKNTNNQEVQISPEEKAFNESGRAKAIEDETDMWEYFEDKKSGFSIKYPGDVDLENSKNGGTYTLDIRIEKFGTFEGLNGYDSETSKSNFESLKKGEYGSRVDWPSKASQEVVKIGDVYAQKFMVFSRFEVCDVTFERFLYFFNNDYMIVVNLKAPKKEMIASSPDYFKVDKSNCGNDKIWDFDKQGDFYSNLKNGTITSEVASNWFKVFDKMIGTIKLTKNQNVENSLLGRWVSVDDADSEIEFVETKQIEYYQGKKMSEGSFVLSGNSLNVNIDGEDYKYTVSNFSGDSLSLIYLARGNTLNYKRVNK